MFAAAMQGVKRIIQKKTISPEAPPKKTFKTTLIFKESEPPLFFSDYEKLDSVGSEDKLDFFRPGIQHKMIRNLRKGQYNAEAVLDLHGKTIEEAREILSHFLLNCQRKGIRHVMIIHGKGRSHSKPIIKNKLNHWLRQTEYVLAFCSATAQDGGTGALYILLRR